MLVKNITPPHHQDLEHSHSFFKSSLIIFSPQNFAIGYLVFTRILHKNKTLFAVIRKSVTILTDLDLITFGVIKIDGDSQEWI